MPCRSWEIDWYAGKRSARPSEVLARTSKEYNGQQFKGTNHLEALFNTILIWIGNNVPAFHGPTVILRAVLFWFPWIRVQIWLSLICNRCKVKASDGLPQNTFMHANFDWLKCFVGALDKNTCKTLLKFASVKMPATTNGNKTSGHGHPAPPSNMSIECCVCAWNLTQGSGSTKGVGHKHKHFILPSELCPKKKTRHFN